MKVAMYHKDNKFWKQISTGEGMSDEDNQLRCITKIINSESKSQQEIARKIGVKSCDVSQR